MTVPVAQKSRTGLVVLVAVLGLVVGAGGVGLAWALSSGSGDAGSDAAAACAALNRATPPAGEFGTDDASRAAMALWQDRMSGAASLARAAADQDPSRKPLADAIQKPVLILAQNFAITPAGHQAYADAVALCERG